jgi:hypothetical protein
MTAANARSTSQGDAIAGSISSFQRLGPARVTALVRIKRLQPTMSAAMLRLATDSPQACGGS